MLWVALTLSYLSSTTTEPSWQVSENQSSWAENFCDLCQNVPRHDSSDHLMSFQEKVLTLSNFVICAGDVPARKSFLSLQSS